MLLLQLCLKCLLPGRLLFSSPWPGDVPTQCRVRKVGVREPLRAGIYKHGVFTGNQGPHAHTQAQTHLWTSTCHLTTGSCSRDAAGFQGMWSPEASARPRRSQTGRNPGPVCGDHTGNDHAARGQRAQGSGLEAGGVQWHSRKREPNSENCKQALGHQQTLKINTQQTLCSQEDDSSLWEF